jgi:dienelactone hydrolase
MKKYIFFLLPAVLLILWLTTFVFSDQAEKAQADNVIALAKHSVELLKNEDFSSFFNSFDNTMKSALPLEKLQSTWKSLIGQVGAFKKQVDIRTEKVQEYDVAIVTCEFEKATLDIRIAFNKEKQVSGLFFLPSKRQAAEYKAPSYVKSDSFEEKEVTVGSGEWALPGTLTLPKGSAPFPAVVLIHGSGPQDRDETIGPNKPFRDLAWGLASRGIAVLRFDKRTLVHRQKLLAIKDSITVKEEVIDDALAAVSLLRSSPEINPKKIFLLGHSLGGMLTPRIGKLDSKISGFIIMAGTTRPLEDVILEQSNYIFSLDGQISDDEKKQLEELKAQIAKVKDPNLSKSDSSATLPLGLPASYWLDLRGYNPAETAKELKQPMLILQGGRDYQVTTVDFDNWKKALSSRKNVTFKFYEKLNHLFSEGEGKITPAEYLNPGHVAEAVINDIAQWILKQ